VHPLRQHLLSPDEPSPITVLREDAASAFLVACEHAGARIPRRLGDLGLPSSELTRHIAWDIGAGAVSCLLGEALGATTALQTYSRLVIDCNRSPGVASSIVELSETTPIPGNIGISAEQRQARRREIFAPYHDRLAALLDARARHGRPTLLIAMHSFTPVFRGEQRRWHAGVLYNRAPRLACVMLDLLRAEGDLVVGDNEPYSVTDLTDYTVPVHGERRGLPHVELEIRQDLIGDAAGQRAWAERLARLLPEAARRLEQDPS
jgi:predicted N-formylglutamate amidohydrolase